MGCCSSQQNVKKPDPVSNNGEAPKPIENSAQKNAGRTLGGESQQVPNSARANGSASQANQNYQVSEDKNLHRIDTPQPTEERQSPNLKDDDMDPNNLKALIANDKDHLKKAKSYSYFDISPKVVKKNKIYHISNTYPVSKPYSIDAEWLQVLGSIQKQAQMQQLQQIQTQQQSQFSEEELVSRILQIRNRNWIKEQISLLNEQNNQSLAAIDSIKTSRRQIQLREHFNWFIWAIAQYYFQQKHENKFNLPKTNAKKWVEGFEFKGVWIKVLPYEEAYYVHNEILALKYIQMELMELNSQAEYLSQHYGQIKEKLHKDVMLPLIAGVSCGGFYLYGTPIIYTQELVDQTREFYRETLNGSKVFAAQAAALHNSMHNSIQMQAIQNQSNLSFSYLHNNISPDQVQDSMFKFMPILKNLTTKNMIPVIDFEEYNEDQKQDIEVKYFLVYLFDILPRLSETSASTLLLKFPCFINEEISFHKFPKNNCMEFRDLKKLILTEQELQDYNVEDSHPYLDPSTLFSKKFFSKHGWDFILMYKKGATNENKRATTFYMQREIPLRKQQQEQQQAAGNQVNMLFLDEYAPKDDTNIEQQQQVQQRYISPHKQSILKRTESISEEAKLNGNALVAAYNYKKDFKLQYSMNNHNYSTNIESLFSASIDQVVRVLENSDNFTNSASLKELFHRKGLNLRFQWAVLAKLRVNQYRDMVMIEILIRVMRRIVNEEVKLKSKVTQHTAVSENHSGAAIIDEYYQGNQTDNFKETLAFYMDTLLRKKLHKYKEVFDESLLGLFLSRMSILGIVHSLNLKKEEYFYLESKDILEDIIDAPSRNPALFINAVQQYFKIDFKPEFLRLLRQDKFAFLSKGKCVSKSDFKSLQFKVNSYHTIREQAYFLLARQITTTIKIKSQKGPGKIKTKTDKDKLKKSFQKPHAGETMNMPSSRIIQATDHNSNHFYQQQNNSIISDSKTHRNNSQNEINKESQTTIRQYQNMDRAIVNDSHEFSQAQLNQVKLSKLNESKRQDIALDFSKLSKRNSFKPTSIQEIILPSILYKQKTYLSNNPMYYFDDSTKVYVGETFTVLKSFYEMPNLDLVDEWTLVLEFLLKDVVSVNGQEQVLLEALVYQALLIYFFKNDNDELFKILAKIRDLLFLVSFCAPETLILIQILTALYFEEKRGALLIEAEKSYLTAMICIFQLYGDPRGRGNITIPYTLFVSWKLSQVSMVEDKKLHDSEFSEEIFDATLKCLFNHRKNYRDQQLQQDFLAKNPTGTWTPPQKSKFELELEKFEMTLNLFDIKKYKNKPFNITIASGQTKSNTIPNKKQNQHAMNVYVSSNRNYNSVQLQQKEIQQDESKQSAIEKKESQIKSKSAVPRLNKNTSKPTGNEYDLDPSDIDLEIEDENKNFFIDENFKNNEWIAVQCPFQHWSLYRQQNRSASMILNRGNQQFNQTSKDQSLKSLPKDQFYQWLLKFNPIMYQSGTQWNRQTIQEVIFCQNQQMVSSSGSSVVLSQHQSSHQSLTSTPSSAKEKRNMHLGSYSQILGKEVGGISKQEMNGVLFTMGTDSNGQLGLDVIASQSMNGTQLRVLYPRMVMPLRDDIIKEICCGHSHTLVLNIHGQMYSWGCNEQGQLGLGPDAPSVIRKPVLNPFISNLMKISTGNEHSLAISKNGDLYVWGSGDLTGLGNDKMVVVPTKMEYFSKMKIQQAVCGGLHTLVVTKDGETFSWGRPEGGQLGLSQKQISQLTDNKEIPVMSPQKIPLLEGIFVIQAACGEAHSIVMSKDGTIFGWGMSNYGQLGLGFSSDSFAPGVGMESSKVMEPKEITALKNKRVTKITCGGTFTLFQTEKGDLYGCGMNDYGQIGLDTFMEDLQAATLEKAKKGNQKQTSDVTVPTKVICFQGISLHNIACGENHSLAVSGDDKNMLWAWGMFKQGQLGLGEVQLKLNPRPVQTLCSSLISKIACGSYHSLALIGESSQVSTLTQQYYANNEALMNYWQCDIRGLGNRDSYAENNSNLDEEVPDDGEGRVKNPK